MEALDDFPGYDPNESIMLSAADPQSFRGSGEMEEDDSVERRSSDSNENHAINKNPAKRQLDFSMLFDQEEEEEEDQEAGKAEEEGVEPLEDMNLPPQLSKPSKKKAKRSSLRITSASDFVLMFSPQRPALSSSLPSSNQTIARNPRPILKRKQVRKSISVAPSDDLIDCSVYLL